MRQQDIIFDGLNNILSNTHSLGGGLAIAYGAQFYRYYFKATYSALSFLFAERGKDI